MGSASSLESLGEGIELRRDVIHSVMNFLAEILAGTKVPGWWVQGNWTLKVAESSEVCARNRKRKGI